MDDYEVVKVCGQGSFGTVLLCKALRSKEFVVIKKVNINSCSDKELSEMLQEVQILSKLSRSGNPFICKYIDSFIDSKVDNQELCIVMEYYEYGKLIICIYIYNLN